MPNVLFQTSTSKNVVGRTFAAVGLIAFSGFAHAQQARAAAPPTAKAGAPIDLTGYWVALITEDWRYRMMVPAKGDFPNVPLNPEGRRVANLWDPAKDESGENQCAAYGAGGITRMTGRYHITWFDDNTLKAEADAGTQTRTFVFGGGALSEKTSAGENTWQGVSRANWEFSGPGRGGGAGGRSGSLRVVTTRMESGYIQRNGVPYSANAVITEYFDVIKEEDGTQYMAVTTLIEDPAYLARRFQRSTHFRKEPDGTKWDPTACVVR